MISGRLLKNIKNILKIELISFFVIVLLVTTVAVNAQTSAEVTSVEPETVPGHPLISVEQAIIIAVIGVIIFVVAGYLVAKTKKTNVYTFVN